MGHVRKKATLRLTGFLVLLVVTVALCSCTFITPRKAKVRTATEILYNGSLATLVLSDMEKEVAANVNDLRRNPKEWAAYLKTFRPGSDEVLEAVEFLNGKGTLPPLKLSKGLCLAARELVNDHGPKGLTGHTGSNGSTFFMRMGKYGTWDGKVGENLYYGYKDADRLMTGILTEGGSTGWKQRNSVLSSDFTVMGLACGPHFVNGIMCVIDFAQEYTEAP